MMATAATRYRIAENKTLRAALCGSFILLFISAVIVTVLVMKLHHYDHHHNDNHNIPPPTPPSNYFPPPPNVTLTFLTTTSFPSKNPWTFSVHISDITHLSVHIGFTSMYVYENASGILHLNVGELMEFYPDPSRNDYSGNLTLSKVDPAIGSTMVRDQSRGIVKPALSVDSMLEGGRPVVWLCIPVMTMITPGDAASSFISSSPVHCLAFTLDMHPT